MKLNPTKLTQLNMLPGIQDNYIWLPAMPWWTQLKIYTPKNMVHTKNYTPSISKHIEQNNNTCISNTLTKNNKLTK